VRRARPNTFVIGAQDVANVGRRCADAADDFSRSGSGSIRRARIDARKLETTPPPRM
jgi:hypothetical protein